jgi:hypothetical protein
MNRDYLIIVTGLPRSGTSLLMQMLSAGGIPVLIDNQQCCDEHNPHGYFEYHRVMNLINDVDASWLQNYKGYAVKIISPILLKIRIDFPARVIWVNRNLEEVVISQLKMAQTRKTIENYSFPLNKEQLLHIFNKHIKQTRKYLSTHSQLKLLEVNFSDCFLNTDFIINSIECFLDGNLNKEQMKCVIDPTLYRNIFE